MGNAANMSVTSRNLDSNEDAENRCQYLPIEHVRSRDIQVPDRILSKPDGGEYHISILMEPSSREIQLHLPCRPPSWLQCPGRRCHDSSEGNTFRLLDDS